MPEPVAEPALNGLRLNLRIVSVVIFNFASYLTIGLPLAVLPGYVHDVMGFSAFWAGLVISLQYFATLLSRPHAGRYADLLGPKKIVVFGLGGCFLSGLDKRQIFLDLLFERFKLSAGRLGQRLATD